MSNAKYPEDAPQPFEVRFATPQPEPTATVLEEANDIIYGDREKTYGAPDVNLRRIAHLWAEYLNQKYPDESTCHRISPEDVCWMMVQLKMARQMNAPKRDNLVDAAGYVALIDRITP